MAKWRYSPLNYLIVDWSFDGVAFDSCGLPAPLPCAEQPEGTPAACAPLPIQEAINTYDWYRWLPEVIVGIEDADEEIAAHYVREAAIEYCRRARVLQRVVTLELECGTNLYPFTPYEDENIVGVLGYYTSTGSQGSCSCSTQGFVDGLDWRFDMARNEITVTGNIRNRQQLALRVWAAPTEGSCSQDVFLYEHFRADITAGARMKYALAVHFRDRGLLGTLIPQDAWESRMIKAKTKAYQTASAKVLSNPSGLWGGSCTPRGAFR